jgi:hypothetical protein
MERYILMQLVNVAFGKRRENDPHKGSPRLSRGAAGRDATWHRIGGNPF